MLTYAAGVRYHRTRVVRPDCFGSTHFLDGRWKPKPASSATCLRNATSFFDFIVEVGHNFSGMAHPELDESRRCRREVPQVRVAKTPECMDAALGLTQLGQDCVQLASQDARLMERLAVPRTEQQARLPLGIMLGTHSPRNVLP